MLFGRTRRKYFAACEYWVYLPGESPPDHELVMKRMIGDNPYSKPGQPAIGRREGLIFSDIRLHIAPVLRTKNPHVFRPDLFREYVEPSAETLAALAESHSLVKIRYISEEPLPDGRHLQFCSHMASAFSDLGGGLAIYDVTGERLVTSEEFGTWLAEDLDASRFDIHVKVVWERGAQSGHAETKGLIKRGLPELRTDEAYLDQRVLVSEVMLETARSLWDASEIPLRMEAKAFGDTFIIENTPTRNGPYKSRILRLAHS